MDINTAWKSTCRVLFGEEVGELDDFRGYLLSRQYPISERKSALNGKRVAICSSRYPTNASIISQDEIDYAKKYPALDMNEIKGTDSILEALSDRFHYCGNKVFGESKFVEGSDNCTDSFFIKESHDVVGSKYVAYSSFIRMGSECIFGSDVLIRGSHLVKILGSADLSRSFDCNSCTSSSDMLFSVYCHGCSNCLFCFNQRNKRYMIGNLELPRERYFEIRNKIAHEVAEHLRKHKRFPSVFDFPALKEKPGISATRPKEQFDISPINEAFEATTGLIFGKPLPGVEKYSKLLLKKAEEIKEAKTALGGKTYYSNYFWSAHVPPTRRIGLHEIDAAGSLKIDLADGEPPDFASLKEKVGKIALYPVEFTVGNRQNCGATPTVYEAMDCYRVSDATYAKKCAYNTHNQNCDSVFGSGILMVESSFCISCNDCVKTSLSFELDSCKSCHRCMFCHNCENLSDSMFCFNAKNLKYAVGNVEVGRTEYERIRKLVVAELLARLGKNGDTGVDICSIGAKK
jgi:hypothetical protein